MAPYGGLRREWDEAFDETAADFARLEPDLERAIFLAAALARQVAEDMVDPAWSLERAALVSVFRSARARVRREEVWAMRAKD